MVLHDVPGGHRAGGWLEALSVMCCLHPCGPIPNRRDVAAQVDAAFWLTRYVASWLSKTDDVRSISALLTQIDQPDGFRTQQGSDPHTARVSPSQTQSRSVHASRLLRRVTARGESRRRPKASSSLLAGSLGRDIRSALSLPTLGRARRHVAAAGPATPAGAWLSQCMSGEPPDPTEWISEALKPSLEQLL
eukprot:COSAG01_NODE_49_length_31891_cov_29.945773_31_plen_191_part_00